MAMNSTRTFGVEFEMFFAEEAIARIVFDHPKLYEVQIRNAGIIASEYDQPNTLESAIINCKTFGCSQVFEMDYYIILKKLTDSYGFKDWAQHEDPSIAGPMPIELVSPILQGNKGLASVAKFCMLMQRYASVNQSTGLHVHVGAKDFLARGATARRLTLALLHYKKFETLFDSLVSLDRRNDQNEFARSIDSENDLIKNYKIIIQKDARKLNALLDIISKGDRYKKLNLESLQKHGTLEFRHMNGTLNPVIVTNWIKICTSFVDMIITTEDNFLNIFKQLSKRPEVDQEEQKKAMDLLAQIKGIISSNDLRSYLIRNLEQEVGTQIIKNLNVLADNLRLKETAYTNPSDKNKNYFYQFTIPTKVIEDAIGLPEKMPFEQKQAIMRRLMWRIRNILLLTFRSAQVVVDNKDTSLYIDNPSYTEKAKQTTVSQDELNPILTAQNKLATRTGVPKGVPAKSFTSIKQNI
jgi:hypothetical protein